MRCFLRLVIIYIFFISSVAAQSNQTGSALIPITQLLLSYETPGTFQCKTSFLSNLNVPVTGNIEVAAQFTSFGDLALFLARYSDFRTKMCVTSKTTLGTAVLKEAMPKASSASEGKTGVVDHQIFFFADDGMGIKRWVTDGTTAGTRLVEGASINKQNNEIENLNSYKGKMYFQTGLDSVSNAEAYRIKEFYNNSPRMMTVLGEALIFNGSSDDYGIELWVSDGTSSGTKLLKDIDNGSSDASLKEFFVMGDKMYFIIDDNRLHSRQLWVTNGSIAGTIKLKDSNMYSNRDVYQSIAKNIRLDGMSSFIAM